MISLPFRRKLGIDTPGAENNNKTNEAEMVIKLLIITLLVLFISVAFLAIRILVKKDGRFPDTHVGHNREMKKRGIRCAQHNDLGCNPTADFPGCSGCAARAEEL